MTASAIAQIIMVLTLLLMITGKTPIYITAICGATISALVAGFPVAGAEGMTISKMVISGLNPVIADMTGILLFIGIMQATGFMDVIIRDISASAIRSAAVRACARQAVLLPASSAL